MHKVYVLIFLSHLFAFSSYRIHAQIQVTPINAQNAVQNVLIGNGVNAFNISSQGSANQLARFTAQPGTPVDFSNGIILSTFGMTAPNCLHQNGPGYFGAGTPGDPDLTVTNGGTQTNNASWIQFDFIPTGDTMKFDYIFMSQEYNFYVNSSFNDVFAFYLTGPNPQGGNYTNQNVAIIPGTNLPVTINNVNNGQSGGCGSGPCSYCQYFIDNCNPSGNSPFTGGYTTNLSVVVPVIPCSTYTIKLGVADVGDGALNSAVLLKENSFTSNLVTLSSEVNYGNSDTIMYEGCSQASVQFIKDGADNINPDTVFFVVTGTATQGVDYNMLPPYIVFPPGTDTVTLTITPFMDQVIDPGETVTLTIYDTICGSPYVATITLVITDVQPLDVSVMPDTSLCLGMDVDLDVNITGGAGFFDAMWYWPGDSSAIPANVTPGNDTYYVIRVYDSCLDTLVFDSVQVKVFPVPNISLDDFTTCSGVPVILGPINNMSGFNYTWIPGVNLNNGNIPNPEFTAINNSSSNEVYVIYIAVDSAGVVCAGDSTVILVYPAVQFDLQPDTGVVCENGTLDLDAGGGYNSYFWSTGATSQVIQVQDDGIYSVTVSDQNACTDSDSMVVIKDFLPVFTVDDQEICQGDTAFLSVPDTLGSILWFNYETSAVVEVTDEGDTYYVTITNSCGSTTDTAAVTIKPNLVLDHLPNVFTPNGDGINDVYMIPELVEALSFNIDIYNRWGMKIFTTSSINQPWDGTAGGGGLVASGTYFVILNFVNCQGQATELNSTITVVSQP